MDDRTTGASTSVLIVGGSLNGLTMALLLARRGVSCLVVERHARTSIQYKFRGISSRSMEIYRSAGIETEIRARDRIDDRSASVARMKNLADSEVSWPWIPPSDTSDISPTTAATCDQQQAAVRRTEGKPGAATPRDRVHERNSKEAREPLAAANHGRGAHATTPRDGVHEHASPL